MLQGCLRRERDLLSACCAVGVLDLQAGSCKRLRMMFNPTSLLSRPFEPVQQAGSIQQTDAWLNVFLTSPGVESHSRVQSGSVTDLGGRLHSLDRLHDDVVHLRDGMPPDGQRRLGHAAHLHVTDSSMLHTAACDHVQFTERRANTNVQ